MRFDKVLNAWKRWIDIVKNCLKKKGLDVMQPRRMVFHRSVWQEFVRGNEPWTLMRSHSYMKPLKRGSLFCGQAHNFKE